MNWLGVTQTRSLKSMSPYTHHICKCHVFSGHYSMLCAGSWRVGWRNLVKLLTQLRKQNRWRLAVFSDDTAEGLFSGQACNMTYRGRGWFQIGSLSGQKVPQDPGNKYCRSGPVTAGALKLTIDADQPCNYTTTYTRP